MNTSDITKLLTSHGLKCTRQRMAVMNSLISGNSPQSAEMIFSKLDNISLSTVYRILEKLTENKIVNKEIFSSDPEVYYEPSSKEHHHYAVCLKCHSLKYIDTCPVHDTKIDDFTVTGHRVELYGYCNKCRQEMNIL